MEEEGERRASDSRGKCGGGGVTVRPLVFRARPPTPASARPRSPVFYSSYAAYRVRAPFPIRAVAASLLSLFSSRCRLCCRVAFRRRGSGWSASLIQAGGRSAAVAACNGRVCARLSAGI